MDNSLPTLKASDHGDLAVEVLARTGEWVAGFELLRSENDGTALIRSGHTGATRKLPQGQWRDPLEIQALEAFAREVQQ
jgi:hypothetical protein